MKFKAQDKQNQLIENISSSHLVIGVDIAQEAHAARVRQLIRCKLLHNPTDSFSVLCCINCYNLATYRNHRCSRYIIDPKTMIHIFATSKFRPNFASS